MTLHSVPAEDDRPPIWPLVRAVVAFLHGVLCTIGFFIATLEESQSFQVFWGVLLVCEAIRQHEEADR